jgi:hypothetical protein
MDFTGKPLKGFLFISQPGYRTAAGLTRWLDEAVAYVKSKPPKKKKAKPSRKAIVTPKRDAARQKKFLAALAKVNRQYGPALKKLAE